MAAKSGIDVTKDRAFRGTGLHADWAPLDPELLACGSLEVLVAKSLPTFSLEPDPTALCCSMLSLDEMTCPSPKFCLHGLGPMAC